MQQRTYYAYLQQLEVDRAAEVRGALFNAGFAEADVARLWLICRELINAEGSMFPPTVADLALACARSDATAERYLGELTRIGIVTTTREAGKSAREPKRRRVNWERVRELARTVKPQPAIVDEPATVSLPHHEGTKFPLPHGEGTRTLFEGTNCEAVHSLKSIDSPPSPKGSPPSAAERFETAAPGRLAAGGDRKVWEDAERRLRALGVFAASKAVGEARGRGANAGDVLAAIEWAEARSDAWSATQIYFRVAGTEAGQPGGDAWPEQAATFRKRQASQRTEAAAVDRFREFDAQAEAVARERAASDAAWTVHGPQIEALDAAERDAMLAEACTPGERMLFRQPKMREGPLYRDALLRAWLKRIDATTAAV